MEGARIAYSFHLDSSTSGIDIQSPVMSVFFPSTHSSPGGQYDNSVVESWFTTPPQSPHLTKDHLRMCLLAPNHLTCKNRVPVSSSGYTSRVIKINTGILCNRHSESDGLPWITLLNITFTHGSKAKNNLCAQHNCDPNLKQIYVSQPWARSRVTSIIL